MKTTMYTSRSKSGWKACGRWLLDRKSFICRMNQGDSGIALTVTIRAIRTQSTNQIYQHSADVNLSSSAFWRTQVNRCAYRIPPTSADLSYRVLLSQFQKCQGTSPPTIWTHDHHRCIPLASSSIWNGLLRGCTAGLGRKRCNWIHRPLSVDWWNLGVSCSRRRVSKAFHYKINFILRLHRSAANISIPQTIQTIG